MKIFLINSFFNFYFENYLNNSCINDRITNLENNCYISNCYFETKLLINGFGGAIYLVNNFISLLIEYTTFFNCSINSNSDRGGAIYIENEGNSILNMICASNCYTNKSPSWYQFGFISTGKNKINNCFYLSINKCSFSNQIDRRHPICFTYGIQIINNINSSNNIVSYVSGISFFNTTQLNSTFLNIINNTNNGYICIFFWCKSKNYLKFNNIIKNNSPNTYGVIYSAEDSNTEFFNCNMFNNLNTLFYSINSLIIISNCYIYHLNNLKFGNILEISNIKNLTSTFLIYHYSTKYCPAELSILNLSKKFKYELNYFQFLMYLIL